MNGASFLNAALPNGNLAPGVLFSVFGSGLGPDIFRPIEAVSFPLPTELEGTRVQVTVGETTVDCLIVFTSGRQIGAILPSHTPVGVGTIDIAYGFSSTSSQIEIVPHAFGIFAVNQSGTGQGVLTDPITSIANSLVASANPGQILDIWGTGLGAVDADEAEGPAPGDLSDLRVQVFVAGQEAEVAYRGRSGCCAGVDQVRFRVPGGVTGCDIPVHVEVEGVPSNFTTMSIAETGPFCDAPGGLTSSDLQTAIQNGRLRTGVVSLSRGRSIQSSSPPRADWARAFFDETRAPLNGNVVPLFPRISGKGICEVTRLSLAGFITASFSPQAGQITLSGPPGSFILPGLGAIQTLGFIPGHPDLSESIIADGTLLTPGTYTFTGSGGATVGPFSASLNLPPLLEWTNQNSFEVIDRSQPLTVTWGNVTPGAWVAVSGSSSIDGSSLGLGFHCWVDGSSGSFTVPPPILAMLPPSGQWTTLAPPSSLSVSVWIFGDRFTATEVDVGLAEFHETIEHPVTYR